MEVIKYKIYVCKIKYLFWLKVIKIIVIYVYIL